MKLIVLAAVVSIAVFRASCRERPEGRDLNDVDRNLADSTKLPEYIDFSDGDDLYYITDLPAGPKDEATTIEPDAFSSEPVDRVSTTDVDMAFPTIEFGPELVQAGFQNNDSSDIDYKWRKDETGQNERKLRVNLEANSKRKENNKLTKAVSVMKKDLKTIKKNIDSIRKHQESLMNFMISSNSSQANLDQMINSLMSTNSNLTIANSNIKNDLEFIIGNVTSANSNMQNELQFIKENFTVAIANQGRTLDSIRKNQGTGCPEGLFLVTRTNQCLRILKESRLTYDASKAACKQLGLELAVVSEPIPLRSYLVTKYGLNYATWIGARYDGSNMKWERTGVVIPKNSPLWWGSITPDTSRSLCILTTAGHMKSKPYQPYYPCGQNNQYLPLCELVRA